MIIGVPKEIKNREHRVAITPDGVVALRARGHQLRLEYDAGRESGFSDAAYELAGAQLVSREEAWVSELVLKVKEPLESEFALLHPGMVLFTYLHLAAAPALAEALCRTGVCAIGYETVQADDGTLPLLTPMSQIAGRLAASMGLHLLMRENGTSLPGMGRIAGGIAGVPPVPVLVLGGGNVGQHAATVASGMGAEVTVVERDPARVAVLRSAMPSARILAADDADLPALLQGSSLLIGAALVPGARAPRLLTRQELRLMPERSVLMDVAIDQGGISESSRVSSYDDPVYLDSGVIHCCLPNMPAAVPQSSTLALTAATLPYVLVLADEGVDGRSPRHAALQCGINVRDGMLRHPAVIAALSA